MNSLCGSQLFAEAIKYFTQIRTAQARFIHSANINLLPTYHTNLSTDMWCSQLMQYPGAFVAPCKFSEGRRDKPGGTYEISM